MKQKALGGGGGVKGASDIFFGEKWAPK